MLYKGVLYSTYEELQAIAEERLSKGEKRISIKHRLVDIYQIWVI